MEKKYDIYAKVLSMKMEAVVFDEFAELLILLGANGSYPYEEDLKFMTLFMSLYLIDLHGEEIDTELADIQENKELLKSIFSNIRELQGRMKRYRMETELLMKNMPTTGLS